MEEKEKRAPMFTVRNAEGAMIAFAIIGLTCLTTVFLHEIWLKGKDFLEALYAIANNFPKIMSAATTLTFIEEGIDIMFQRLRDSLARDKKLKAKEREEARAEGYEEGYEEGYAKGRSENGSTSNESQKSPKKPAK